MKKLILTLFLIFVSINLSFSQAIEVKKIIINGSNLFPEKEIKNFLSISGKTSKDVISNRMKALMTEYINYGYLDISVSSEYTSKNNCLTVKIYEGNKYNFNVNSTENRFELERKKFFAIPDIDEKIEEILDYYNNNGYPFANICIDSFSTKNDIINMHLNLNKGRRVVIDTIVIKGAAGTNRSLIIKESGLKKGMLYDKSKLDRAESYLKRSDFVDLNDIGNLFVSGNEKYGIIIDVTEKKSSRFDGIIGYIPKKKQTEKGYFTGEINLALKNISGTGRNFALRWYKPKRNNQEISLSYTEPWVFGFSISGVFNQSFYDSLYTRREFELSIKMRISEKIDGNIKIGTQNVIPGENNENLPNSKGISISAGFTYYDMDNIINPTGGIFYSSQIDYFFRKSNLQNRETETTDKKMSLNFEAAKTVFKKNVLFLKINGAKISTSKGEIPASEMFFLGGSSDLRGYREQQFRTPYSFYSNVEYRYILDKYSRLFLFFDQGYFKLEDKFVYKSGYGFGFRLKSGIGIIGFDFAFSFKQSFSESKIHIRMINNF